MINELLLQLQYNVYGSNELSGPPWNTSFPCPTTIVTRPERNSYCIENPDGAYCRFPNMTLTHTVLTHCPNVETLDVQLDDGGCLGPELDLWEFPFKDGDQYPPLKSLKLDGYRFGGLTVKEEEDELSTEYCMGPADKVSWENSGWWIREDEWSNRTNAALMKQWETQGGKPKSNLEMWLEAMDWSQLEELSIDTRRTQMADAIAQLPQRLTSLKRLTLNSLPFIAGLKNNTLETLHWIGKTRPDYLSAILSHQGQTLQTLTYRCDELSCPYWPSHIPPTLPLLPHLTHLSINLPRSTGTQPLLSALTHLPSLTSLDLHLPMQNPCKQNLPHPHHPNCRRVENNCFGTESYATPYLNASTAASMFRVLRAEIPGTGLTTATFKTGDWSKPWSAMDMPPLAHRRCAVFCRVEGGEVCEGVNEGYWRGGYGEWVWDGEMWVVDEEEEWDGMDNEAHERVKERLKGIERVIAEGH